MTLNKRMQTLNLCRTPYKPHNNLATSQNNPLPT